jgi:hypothetical protein
LEPTLPNAQKVTNYGEIVRDPDWTPHYIYNYDSQSGSFYIFTLENPDQAILNPDQFLENYLRFVDTSSNIDIVGFKHSFVNLPGLENPNFSVKFFSSDRSDASEGEWQQIAFVNSDTNILFLTEVKRYLKIEASFDAVSNISEADFLFLIQVNIDDINSPVITDHARSVLSKFPSWTKMYSDSIEKATPEIALPESQAGKIINAILGEDLDKIDELISEVDTDSFISTANINQVAWVYVSTPVRPGFIKVIGDGVELARVSSYEDLMQLSFNDYAFYYNFVTQELITIRPYTTLYIDLTELEQIPVQNYNYFDEMGLRVGLQRLYLETNLNFKKRILDVYKNPPSVDINGLKLTLRRELDIWRAYGATPDSDYLGATPEVVEISDLQKINSKYFDAEGNPKEDLFVFVEDLNNRFPTNIGYAKWGETYWDYAGLKQEGVSSIPKVSDAATVDSGYYQPGIGDFDDAKIILESLDKDVNQYNFDVKIHGIKSTSTEAAREPIVVEYDSYVSYLERYVDNQYATINYDVILKLKPHGEIEQEKEYSTNLTDIVRNTFETPASPEHIYRDIFMPSLFSDSSIKFIDSNEDPYQNTISASPNGTYTIKQIPISAVDQATINFLYSQDSYGATGDYGWIQFADMNPADFAYTENSYISKELATPDVLSLRLKLSSKIWEPKKSRIVNTQKVRSSSFGNVLNQSSKIDSTNDIVISAESIKKNFILPTDATPIYVHIDNVPPTNYDIDLSDASNIDYGGVSQNREDGLNYFIPSSPNILMKFINPNFATPDLHEDYIETSSSTVSYYFTRVKFPYESTPDYMVISSQDSNFYPFEYKVWQNFDATHSYDFEFYLSKDGIVKSSPDINYETIDNTKQDLIGSYNLYRSDFDLSEFKDSQDLIIKSIEIINENEEVSIWQENSYDRINGTNLNYWNEELSEYTLNEIILRASYISLSEKYMSPSIRSGWYYQKGEEGFVYADPIEESWSNSDKHKTLSVVRSGSPVVVSVEEEGSTPVQYRQISFFEEATPSAYSYYNHEYLVAQDQDYLNLAYSNFFDASIHDLFTGVTIASGLSSIDNTISAVGLLTTGRTYRVTYRVKNAFYLDNNIYDTENSRFCSEIMLASTPDSSFDASVTYESAVYDKDYELNNVKLNPLYSAVDEGYLYLSHEKYDAASVDAFVSPNNILSNNVDYMILNLFSKDVNRNPKPSQTFHITGNNIAATPGYATTDNDGYASVRINYTGAPLTTFNEAFIYVNGLDYPAENANENSESQGIAATVNYYIQPDPNSYTKLFADTDKKIITADGAETINIFGRTAPNSVVYWKKARNLRESISIPFSASEDQPGQENVSGCVFADQNGIFTIGPFIAQPDAVPGYWFVSVESELSSTPRIDPVTISGDIVYWYEKYDASQSSADEPIYIPFANNSSEYTVYWDDPVIKSDIISGDRFLDSEASPGWNLPKWYPINRFTQYQLGFLGSTPSETFSFENLRPDYEED